MFPSWLIDPRVLIAINTGTIAVNTTTLLTCVRMLRRVPTPAIHRLAMLNMALALLTMALAIGLIALQLRRLH
ncbi:MAG TPA: hypothetical protein VGF33_03045 [Caulobacteraceae bacterium]|jgi:hypothetical protein